FLMMNNNWSGFIMDSSVKSISRLKRRNWYWKYTLRHKSAFIDTDNINQLLSESGLSNIGLLSIDIDGNDYFILKELDFAKLNPAIIIVEYNSVFGPARAITVPYRKDFMRTKAHYSNLFFGASLSALTEAASAKGYVLVGCTLAGNNAFFVRKDLLNEKVKRLSVEEAFKESKFRESRNQDYSLSFLSGEERLETIKGLEVINVLTNEKEKL
ncbi:MAG: FkbM family methyltransferase, partial [Ginsengibacter sp.]